MRVGLWTGLLLVAGVAHGGDCSRGKEGPPHFAETIGIQLEESVPLEFVLAAVRQWESCEGYGVDFPAFVIGATGTQTIRVAARVSSGVTRCGSFSRREVVLYQAGWPQPGKVDRCGSLADLLAHELGHVLSLTDAPPHRECYGHAMADLRRETGPRHVRPDECAAAGKRWLTPAELDGLRPGYAPRSRRPLLVAEKPDQ